jgi:hypothetical protein
MEYPLTSWIIERVTLVHEILSTYIEGEGEDDGGEEAFFLLSFFSLPLVHERETMREKG